MKSYRTLADFTPEQIERFTEIHLQVQAQNLALKEKREVKRVVATDEEMDAYHAFREILTAREALEGN